MDFEKDDFEKKVNDGFDGLDKEESKPESEASETREKRKPAPNVFSDNVKAFTNEEKQGEKDFFQREAPKKVSEPTKEKDDSYKPKMWDNKDTLKEDEKKPSQHFRSFHQVDKKTEKGSSADDGTQNPEKHTPASPETSPEKPAPKEDLPRQGREEPDRTDSSEPQAGKQPFGSRPKQPSAAQNNQGEWQPQQQGHSGSRQGQQNNGPRQNQYGQRQSSGYGGGQPAQQSYQPYSRPYRQPQQSAYSPQMQMIREHNKRGLKKEAGFSGILSMSVPAFMNLIVFVAMLVLAATKFMGFNMNDTKTYGLGVTGYQIFNAIIYLISLGLPAIFIPIFYRKKMNPFARYKPRNEDGKGPGYMHLVLILFLGLALCVVAQVAGGMLTVFFEDIGIPLPPTPESGNETLMNLAIAVVTTAIFPAFLEEIIWRGYVLRSLRPYGDGFAVVVSAFLFGLMHGNIIQIPFAFMVGLVLGFVAVKTRSIWPSIGLHFLNNFMAVLMNYLSNDMRSSFGANKMTLTVYGIIFVVGIISLIILIAIKSPVLSFKKEDTSGLSGGEKIATTLKAPGFIIGLVISALIFGLSIYSSIL